MSRRTGATLVEVLVAIFVMGIGMLTLLTLFPIGVLTMAQAIQDDRTARAADNAEALANILGYRQDSGLDAAFLNPGTGGWANAQDLGPSYPLYLDPIGMMSFSAPYTNYIGGQPTRAVFVDSTRFPPNCSGIHRVQPSYMAALESSGQTALKRLRVNEYFISPDDIDFDDNAEPRVFGSPPAFKRKSSYSWAYLLQRPMNGNPNVVDMSIVVYNKRPLTLDARAQPDETQYLAIFEPATKFITLSWPDDPVTGQDPPNLRLGDWILDSTPVQSGGVWGPPHANFYRVVAITEQASAPDGNGVSRGSMEIEVQAPIRDFPSTGSHTGLITVMDGVAEVFQIRVRN